MVEQYGYSITSTKRLRACMKCHLIKTEEEWRNDEKIGNSCPNCDNQVTLDQTTQHFEGLLAITKPEESWVAKSQNLSNRVPGIYCLKLFAEDDEEDDYQEDDNA